MVLLHEIRSYSVALITFHFALSLIKCTKWWGLRRAKKDRDIQNIWWIKKWCRWVFQIDATLIAYNKRVTVNAISWQTCDP